MTGWRILINVHFEACRIVDRMFVLSNLSTPALFSQLASLRSRYHASAFTRIALQFTREFQIEQPQKW